MKQRSDTKGEQIVKEGLIALDVERDMWSCTRKYCSDE